MANGKRKFKPSYCKDGYPNSNALVRFLSGADDSDSDSDSDSDDD